MRTADTLRDNSKKTMSIPIEFDPIFTSKKFAIIGQFI